MKGEVNHMKRKIIISISIIIIVVLLCIFHYDNRKEESKETKNVSYNTNEKLVSIDVGYSGNTEWDVMVIDFEDETLHYTTYEDNLDVKIYQLTNSNKIYEYFKEHILYGKWDGSKLKQTHYMSEISPQDMGKEKLWSIYVTTSDEECSHRFSDYDAFPTFWYELVELICEGAGVRSEEFGIVIEELQNETDASNNSTDITNIKIQYEGVPNINKGVINIDFNTNEMLFESADNINIRYKLKNSHRIINYLKDNVLCDDWDEDMIEPPDEVMISRPAEYYPRKLLWTITIDKSNEEYIYGDYEKYPFFWYELIDLICEETGATRRNLDIH